MPSPIKFQVGDWVEYKPSYPKAADAAVFGEVGEITRLVDNYAVVRFENGSEARAYLNFLSWQPSPADIEAERDRFRKRHLRLMRSR
jgi:hypothetical protein